MYSIRKFKGKKSINDKDNFINSLYQFIDFSIDINLYKVTLSSEKSNINYIGKLKWSKFKILNNKKSGIFKTRVQTVEIKGEIFDTKVSYEITNLLFPTLIFNTIMSLIFVLFIIFIDEAFYLGLIGIIISLYQLIYIVNNFIQECRDFKNMITQLSN